MKPFLITLGTVIAVAIIAGSVYIANSVKNQKAIVKVFSEQSEAASVLRQDLHKHQKKPSIPEIQEALKTYANSLQSIDASFCPKDFRLAWFDYVSAVSDLSNKNFTASAAGDLLELAFSVWTKDGKLAENAFRDANPSQIRVYYHRCERIAVSYGVRFYPAQSQEQN